MTRLVRQRHFLAPFTAEFEVSDREDKTELGLVMVTSI